MRVVAYFLVPVLFILSGCGGSKTETSITEHTNSNNNTTTTKTDKRDTHPQSISIKGTYKNTPSILAFGSQYIFSYEVTQAVFTPSSSGLDGTYTQLDLSTATSMSVISPSTGSCSFRNVFGFIHDGQHDLNQFFINEVSGTTVCANFLNSMGLNGFHIQFSGVKYYGSSETVDTVDYTVTP